jgi:hypothetical protein
MRPPILRKPLVYTPDTLGVEIAYIYGHRTPRDSAGRIDLRYVVILDVHYMDNSVQTQATEMNAELMEERQIPNFRLRIDDYWEDHTVRPNTAREILTIKRPENYRPLWGRLPSSEAQALYVLDLLGYLSYWRPRYTINDVVRVFNNVIVRTENRQEERPASIHDRRAVAQSSLQRITATPVNAHWSTMVRQRDDSSIDLPSPAQGTS